MGRYRRMFHVIEGDEKLDAAKAALEQLPNVINVTVGEDSGYTSLTVEFHTAREIPQDELGWMKMAAAKEEVTLQVGHFGWL